MSNEQTTKSAADLIYEDGINEGIKQERERCAMRLETAVDRVSRAIFGCAENASREDIAKAAILATLEGIREPSNAIDLIERVARAMEAGSGLRAAPAPPEYWTYPELNTGAEWYRHLARAAIGEIYGSGYQILPCEVVQE
jgi:hypothetical protein